MDVVCTWEHNGNDSIIYADDFPGAYTRGRTKEEALIKMPGEIVSYLNWCGLPAEQEIHAVIQHDVPTELNVADADSAVLLESEKKRIAESEYLGMKELALKSAEDFLRLYEAVPDKHISVLEERKTFYGARPRTAEEMYVHTKNVNAYYFGEIGVEADNEGNILECRKQGFTKLEATDGYLENVIFTGSYGEKWTLKKVLRRFIWHDRIHAKAMYKMAVKTFKHEKTENVFGFEI